MQRCSVQSIGARLDSDNPPTTTQTTDSEWLMARRKRWCKALGRTEKIDVLRLFVCKDDRHQCVGVVLIKVDANSAPAKTRLDCRVVRPFEVGQRRRRR